MSKVVCFLVFVSLWFSSQNRPHAEAKQFAILPKMRAAEAFYGFTRDGCNDRLKNDPYALEHNLTCLYTGSLKPDVEENVRIVNELIKDEDVFGISVSVLDTEAYAPVINRGVELGIANITFDGDAPDSDR